MGICVLSGRKGVREAGQGRRKREARMCSQPLLVWFSGWSVGPWTVGFQVRFSSKAHISVAGLISGPGQGMWERQQWMCVFVSPSLSFSRNQGRKYPQVTRQNKTKRCSQQESSTRVWSMKGTTIGPSWWQGNGYNTPVPVLGCRLPQRVEHITSGSSSSHSAYSSPWGKRAVVSC